MSNHTPAPWKAQLARSNRIQVSGPDGRQIALIWRHGSAETYANKLLIAAAPALLKELSDFHGSMVGLGLHECEGLGQCSVADALFLATGVTP